MQPLVVTLDGPAGSGKSTVARLLAARLGVAFLDTGAMYRAITAVALDSGLDTATQAAEVTEMARRLDLRFDWNTDPPRLHADGRDVTDRLRDADVTRGVSDVAAMPQVRQILVEAQRRIGREHPRLVTEGRDQGSLVFPRAQAKFFLDAAPAVRARRRALQLREAGKPADEAQILQAILLRDHRDRSRPDGPLVCPADAEAVDTSDLGIEQVVDLLERRVRGKLSAASGAAGAIGGTRGTGGTP